MSQDALKRPVALIVDDEELVCEILQGFLTSYFPGFKVEIAVDGFEGGVKAHRCLPDLILMDILLPGQSGFSLCQQIRSIPELSKVTIIALSGMQDKSVKDMVMELGVNDFLVKPYKARDLMQKIEGHLSPELKGRLAVFADAA